MLEKIAKEGNDLLIIQARVKYGTHGAGKVVKSKVRGNSAWDKNVG